MRATNSKSSQLGAAFATFALAPSVALADTDMVSSPDGLISIRVAADASHFSSGGAAVVAIDP